MVPLIALAAVSITTTTTTCGRGTPAAAANAASLVALAWAPFNRPEVGWAVYAPKVGAEVGTQCPADSPGFAAALSGWQRRHGLAATGVFDPETFGVMKAAWQSARPFVHVDGKAHCPAPPDTPRLATARSTESYGGKVVQLRVSALAAFRAMLAAARRDTGVAAEPRSLTIFSGFRDPASDAARCAAENNCNGIVRATCSAHRTGLATDLWVGTAPGLRPDSSADANRAAMTHAPQYRWLLANAARFGFVNYVFEPWHWEWTGEPI